MMRRIIVVDGNFKAELLKPRKPEADLALTAGEAYVTEKERYAKHLKEGNIFPQVMLCFFDPLFIMKVQLTRLHRNLHVTIIKLLQLVILIVIKICLPLGLGPVLVLDMDVLYQTL